MHKIVKLFGCSMLGGLLILLRYILRTPQPLASALPGEDHIYKWTHGHIFYKVAGALDAPPLVLLHAPAIGASAYEMRYVMTRLAHHYRVYAPDLLGFGLSDHPDIDYSADIYVALYRDFLNDVVKQPAVLLASGLSCNYAVALASGAPELCLRLFLLSPVTLFEQTRPYPWLERLARVPLLDIFLYSLLTPSLVLRRVVAWQHDLDKKLLSDHDFDYYFSSAHQLGAHYAALAFITGRLALDVTQQFETLQQPVLIIWGGRALQHVQSVMKQYAASPQMQMVFLRDAGLYAHEEVPQDVVANILRWQERQDIPNEVLVNVSSDGQSTSSLKHAAVDLKPSHESAQMVQDSQPIPVMKSELVSDTSTDKETVEAYCVKCKQKRVMQNARRIVTKNGRNAMEGTCPFCSTKLFRFISL